MTTESLPPENSSAGFSMVAATSRMMCTASASSFSRSVSSYVDDVMAAFPERVRPDHSANTLPTGLIPA